MRGWREVKVNVMVILRILDYLLEGLSVEASEGSSVVVMVREDAVGGVRERMVSAEEGSAILLTRVKRWMKYGCVGGV
jgi:hypothetical protein